MNSKAPRFTNNKTRSASKPKPRTAKKRANLRENFMTPVRPLPYQDVKASKIEIERMAHTQTLMSNYKKCKKMASKRCTSTITRSDYKTPVKPASRTIESRQNFYQNLQAEIKMDAQLSSAQDKMSRQ